MSQLFFYFTNYLFFVYKSPAPVLWAVVISDIFIYYLYLCKILFFRINENILNRLKSVTKKLAVKKLIFFTANLVFYSYFIILFFLCSFISSVIESTCQISFAYSRIVLSLENLPIFAELIIDFSTHFS